MTPLKLKEPLGHWSTWLWSAALCMLGLFLAAPGFLLQVLPGLIPQLGADWQAKASLVLGLAGVAAKFVQQAWVAERIGKLKAWLAEMAKSGSGEVKKAVAVGGGVIGTAVLIATPMVQHYEGLRNKPYLDSVGIVTVCWGHTGGVDHRTYTTPECGDLLDNDLLRHGQVVLTCSPSLADYPDALAAFMSFDFNTGQYCKSTARKMIDAGDLAGACKQLDRWIFAGGKKLNGLVLRRADERALCEAGI